MVVRITPLGLASRPVVLLCLNMCQRSKHLIVDYLRYLFVKDINNTEYTLVNLNSKGKIQFKSPNSKTIFIIALLIIAINGGGLNVKYSNFDLDLSTDGIIHNIIDYQNNNQDIEIKNKLIHSLDSLKVESPDDALKVIKQFSTNKDIPK